MKTKGLLYSAALSVALLLGGCEAHELAPRETTKGEKDPTTAVLGDGMVFNTSKYQQYVSAAFNNKTVGAIFRTQRNDLAAPTIIEGYATYLGPYAPGPAPHHPGTFLHDPRMETMQLSSTITATALLKVLEGKAGGVSVDSPLFPYLPSDWKLGPNLKLLTFRHLLSHGSGLAPASLGLAEPETDRYENLRQIIANGIPAKYIQKRNGQLVIVDNRRQSLNYALLRVLIPYLHYGAGKYKATELLNVNASTTAHDYVGLVNLLVFTPSGVVPNAWNNYSMPDVFPTGNLPAPRFYEFGNLNNWWEQDAQGRLYAGANRWIVSSKDYINFMDYLWNGKLLVESSLQVMKNGLMGMSSVTGLYGKYYYQKGYAVKNGAGLTTFWMAFPDGQVSVLYLNSVGGLPNDSNGTPDLQTVFRNAYDQAWEVVQ
jgi:hypothetical protein